jgi:hypothetical protein
MATALCPDQALINPRCPSFAGFSSQRSGRDPGGDSFHERSGAPSKCGSCSCRGPALRGKRSTGRREFTPGPGLVYGLVGVLPTDERSRVDTTWSLAVRPT